MECVCTKLPSTSPIGRKAKKQGMKSHHIIIPPPPQRWWAMWKENHKNMVLEIPSVWKLPCQYACLKMRQNWEGGGNGGKKRHLETHSLSRRTGTIVKSSHSIVFGQTLQKDTMIDGIKFAKKSMRINRDVFPLSSSLLYRMLANYFPAPPTYLYNKYGYVLSCRYGIHITRSLVTLKFFVLFFLKMQTAISFFHFRL